MDRKAKPTRVITLPYKVKVIAQRVRTWAEKMAPQFGFDKDLCGMCALASTKLHHELKKQGIESHLQYADGHVYLKVGERIVDVTATQFGTRKKVFAAHNPEHAFRALTGMSEPDRDYGANPWKVKRRFKNWRSMRTHQVKEGWPVDQIPNTAETEQKLNPRPKVWPGRERDNPDDDGNW